MASGAMLPLRSAIHRVRRSVAVAAGGRPSKCCDACAMRRPLPGVPHRPAPRPALQGICTGPPRQWRPYRKSPLTAARGSSHHCDGMQPGPRRRDAWISPCAPPFVGGGFSTVGNYCSRLSVLKAEWIWALCSVDTHDAVFAALKHVLYSPGMARHNDGHPVPLSPQKMTRTTAAAAPPPRPTRSNRRAARAPRRAPQPGARPTLRG